MNVELIGTWAGLVWNVLNDANAPVALKAIKKATKLKVNELYAAIGWLAREGKISLAENEADVEVALL